MQPNTLTLIQYCRPNFNTTRHFGLGSPRVYHLNQESSQGLCCMGNHQTYLWLDCWHNCWDHPTPRPLVWLTPQNSAHIIKIRQKLLGEICSMVLAIPGDLSLLLTLQDSLSKDISEGRIRLNQPMHDILADFFRLASQLDLHPTRIS